MMVLLAAMPCIMPKPVTSISSSESHEHAAKARSR